MKETQPTTISKEVGNAFAGFAVLNHAAEMMMKELQRNMHAEKIDLKQERKLLFKQLKAAVERTKYLYEQSLPRTAYARRTESAKKPLTHYCETPTLSPR